LVRSLNQQASRPLSTTKDNQAPEALIMSSLPSPSSSSSSPSGPVADVTPGPQERIRRLDFAVQQVLKNNFDADSKVCLTTVMKMIDNLLAKPDNEQVRSIRLTNPTFHSKVVQKQGHLILLAAGFVVHPDPNAVAADTDNSTTLSTTISTASTGGEEQRLILHPHHEDTQFLVEIRRRIHTVLVHELNTKPDTLPTQPEVRRRVEVRTTTDPSGHTTTTTSTGFDVYRGQRFDGQSAAVGTRLGPPDGWKSKTEQQLEKLQNRQRLLEEQAAGPDRQWELIFPGQQPGLTSQQGSIVTSVVNGLLGGGGASTTTAAATTTGDSSLLAQHYKQQATKRVEAENRGFTTKAMRDLEKMKKQKVYSHTVLAITFADGVVVKGTFKPREKLQAVMKELRDTVMMKGDNNDSDGFDFELYQTPPRTLLKPTETLVDLGLVPAAKVHVSWKKMPNSQSNAKVGGYLRDDFIRQQQDQQKQSSSISIPTGTAIAESDKGSAIADDESQKPHTETGIAKKKKTKADKEKDLLARMMGK
jgi:hypothetical protein